MRKNRFNVAVLIAAAALIAAMAGGCGIIKAFLPASSTPAATSAAPAATETPAPTAAPTAVPTQSPSPTPSSSPTPSPTLSPTPTPTPSPTPTAAPLTVSVKYIKLTDDYVEINAAYPVISGMADTAFQKTFNAQVKSEMTKRADQLAAGAKQDYDDAAAGGYGFMKHKLDSAVKVHLNDGSLLSLTVNIDWYTGGAHGSAEGLYRTILNAEPAKQFALTELFTKPAAAKSRIIKSVKSEIAKSPDDYFESPAVTVSDDTWFYLTKTKLHIVFSEYSIAPYAGGEPDFGISLTSLKDILIEAIPH